MLDFLNVTRALTDENRLRALMALRDRAMCVCQVTAFLDLAPSTTSKHLTILRQARLIEGRKRGKWVYYQWPDREKAAVVIRDALGWVATALAEHPLVAEDRRRIRGILERERCAGLHPEVPVADAHDDCGHSNEIHTLVHDEEEPV